MSHLTGLLQEDGVLGIKLERQRAFVFPLRSGSQTVRICVRPFQERGDALSGVLGSAGVKRSGLQRCRVRTTKTRHASKTHSAGIAGLQPGGTQLFPHQHRRHSAGLMLRFEGKVFFYIDL